jgi:diguanylate cyclase (GGDEF)-like protein
VPVHLSNSAGPDGLYDRRPGKNSLLRSLPDALVAFDVAGSVSYVNQRAEQLLGWDGRLAIGKPVSEVLLLQGGDCPLLTPEYIAGLCAEQSSSGVASDCYIGTANGGFLRIELDVVAVSLNTAILLFRPRDKDVRGSFQRSLLYRASHDVLTGLPNRASMQEKLSLLHRSAARERMPYSLLLLDLDHFKAVNDRYGHASGDRVLVQCAYRIDHSLRGQDAVGRWGGEEFLCLLPLVPGETAENIAERVRTSVAADPVVCKGQHIQVTASIGVATFPKDGREIDELLAKADAALYEAKRTGRNRVQVVTGSSHNVFGMASQIESALRSNRLRTAYQPIVDLRSGRICGEQALARIFTSDGRILEADRFVPAAEQLRLLHQVDRRVAQDAIGRCVSRSLEGHASEALFVNFSGDLLGRPDLMQEILETMKRECARCGLLEGMEKPMVVEISEREFVNGLKEAKQVLRPFLDAGVRLAIDDFGTGFASLTYLAELPISFIKLARPLVAQVCTGSRVRNILLGVQELANDLGMITLAEGIEDEATVQELTELGIHWGQGYYFGMPEVAPPIAGKRLN